MGYMARLICLFASCLTVGPVQPPSRHTSGPLSVRVPSFNEKLDKRIEHFETAGHTLIASVLDLAYEYELPTAIEYIDHDAAARSLNLGFHDESVRGILVALVQSASAYRLSFSDGLVDIYSPRARDDSSNLLNKPIKNFAVTALDTHVADLELLCTLSGELEPRRPCGGSIATGQWGPAKITVHLQNARVYEIVNAIVAQNGKAIWIVIVPPDKLSTVPAVGGLWHICPLESPFKSVVLDKVAGIAAESDASRTAKP
jgi:hypothetical protein